MRALHSIPQEQSRIDSYLSLIISLFDRASTARENYYGSDFTPEVNILMRINQFGKIWVWLEDNYDGEPFISASNVPSMVDGLENLYNNLLIYLEEAGV